MNTVRQADIMLEIIYGAYATHIKVAQSKSIAALKMDADEYARKHWEQNLPGVQTLWTGLVKAVIHNVAAAQAKGELPAMIQADVIAPMLPGLGAPIVDPREIPAGLARRLAARFRGEPSPSRTAPAAGGSPAPALDVSPGLAIGRSTECDGPADNDSSDCGTSDSGGSSDGGGGGGD